MVIELSEELEAAVKAQAAARGMAAEALVRELVAGEFAPVEEARATKPSSSALDLWAKYGITLNQEDIDEKQREMLLGTNRSEVTPAKPMNDCYGMWAKYGPGPSAEDIDENRKEMFRTWGEDF